ncbi:MAG: amidohydrolase [Gammaproteobacteria bacterium]|nr:amidohydrolase [Gammaproteobacteria bacterium]
MSRLPCLCHAAIFLSAVLAPGVLSAGDLKTQIEPALDGVAAKVIAWRRNIHEHPELGNREVRTAKLVADHLRTLDMEVRTAVAYTGVVGTLRGGRPGPVVALRADMDALPVAEPEGLPFASKVKTMWKGQETGVMHACGHDAHVAILMGAAEALAGVREQLPGTVKFIFQPAEESPPEGEEGGAKLMIAEGVLDGPDAPEAIFGLHVLPLETGRLYVKPEGAMAAADELAITIRGQQTHASMPWRGVDPITIAAQILLALQTITSRQVDLTLAPAVISAGSIHGGNRGNIIPDNVEIEGTIRTFDRAMQEDIQARVRRTVMDIASSAGASAEVRIEPYAPVTYNDPALTGRMSPSLAWAAGANRFKAIGVIAGAEDFSRFQERIPGVYFFLGINKEGVGDWEAAPNHSPLFYINENALIVGVRAMVAIAVDYLTK